MKRFTLKKSYNDSFLKHYWDKLNYAIQRQKQLATIIQAYWLQ